MAKTIQRAPSKRYSIANFYWEDANYLQNKFVEHVKYTLARTQFNLDNFAGYQAAAYT